MEPAYIALGISLFIMVMASFYVNKIQKQRIEDPDTVEETSASYGFAVTGVIVGVAGIIGAVYKIYEMKTEGGKKSGFGAMHGKSDSAMRHGMHGKEHGMHGKEHGMHGKEHGMHGKEHGMRHGMHGKSDSAMRHGMHGKDHGMHGKSDSAMRHGMHGKKHGAIRHGMHGKKHGATRVKRSSSRQAF
jgi:hypothetical protein